MMRGTTGERTIARTLPPHLARQIQACIDRGTVKDTDDVLEAALALLDDEAQRRARLDAILGEAEADVAAGRVTEWSPELRARIVRNAKARLRADPHLDAILDETGADVAAGRVHEMTPVPFAEILHDRIPLADSGEELDPDVAP